MLVCISDNLMTKWRGEEREGVSKNYSHRRFPSTSKIKTFVRYRRKEEISAKREIGSSLRFETHNDLSRNERREME